MKVHSYTRFLIDLGSMTDEGTPTGQAIGALTNRKSRRAESQPLRCDVGMTATEGEIMDKTGLSLAEQAEINNLILMQS